MELEQPSLRVRFWQRLGLAFWGAVTGLLLSLSAEYFYNVLVAFWSQAPDVPLPATLMHLVGMPWGALSFACGFAIAGIGAGLLSIQAAKVALLRSKARIWRADAETQTFSVIIFALSPPYRGKQPHPVQQKLAEGISLAQATSLVTKESRFDLLNRFCQKESVLAGVNWQQSFRLLRHNFDTLKHAYLVLSPEAKPHLEDFKALAAPLFPQVKFDAIEKLVDRNDYNDLTEALGMAISEAQGQGFKLSDICIDTTSGTAVYSAAAMVKALNSDIMLSYFGSFGGDDEGKPIIMNATIES